MNKLEKKAEEWAKEALGSDYVVGLQTIRTEQALSMLRSMLTKAFTEGAEWMLTEAANYTEQDQKLTTVCRSLDLRATELCRRLQNLVKFVNAY